MRGFPPHTPTKACVARPFETSHQLGQLDHLKRADSQCGTSTKGLVTDICSTPLMGYFTRLKEKILDNSV